eukprot:CAMPEP_0198493510 /NCGR_PEP_ID=MMETSP1462-20131121/4065_1 /TAXON_ID=1333877 /ORGANISM="Brandtodinium nutriculum, Strain RCC3387" /LENGTH=187 /DNA_ID=CAMNT_0044222203 /DNA_START=60 /DNA_END=619 /DNA_ORIENTATION=+
MAAPKAVCVLVPEEEDESSPERGGQPRVCRVKSMPTAGAARLLRVRNTFIDTSAERSPSLDRFFRERTVHSCPGRRAGCLKQSVEAAGFDSGAQEHDASTASVRTADTDRGGASVCSEQDDGSSLVGDGPAAGSPDSANLSFGDSPYSSPRCRGGGVQPSFGDWGEWPALPEAPAPRAVLSLAAALS